MVTWRMMEISLSTLQVYGPGPGSGSKCVLLHQDGLSRGSERLLRDSQMYPYDKPL